METTCDTPGTQKRRGRPASGTALSAADRKRAQRQRDRQRMRADDLLQALPDMTLSGLVAELQAYVTLGGQAMVEAICNELIRRAGVNADNRK